MKEDRLYLLENGKIGKLIFLFSVPTVIGLLVNATYIVIDRIFVGNGVGSVALTSMAIIHPILIMTLAFSMLTGVGSTALISIKLGEKNKDEAEKILGNAFVLALILGVVLSVSFYFALESMLIAFGAQGEVLSNAKDFCVILIPATFVQLTLFTLNNNIRGQGDPKTCMVTMLFTSVVNIILNAFFIFTLKLGIKGSALATVIAQSLGAIWVISYFFSKRSTLKFRISYMKLKLPIIKEIFSIGLPSFVMQIAASAIIIIINTELKQYGGDLAVASYGIVNSTLSLFLMPIFGLNQGIQPIFGYNFGAKKFDRLKQTLKVAMVIATIICTFGFLVIYFFSNSVVSLFSDGDMELIAICSRGLFLFVLVFPIAGFQIILVSYFQSIGKAKHAMFFILLRQVIAFVLFLYILPKFFHLDGIWLSAPSADIFSGIVMVFFLIYEWKYLEKMKKMYSLNNL
jgi:putative MATE family efflux protein